MEYGPIQLVVIGFDDNNQFKGDIARELSAVRSRGMIRLIDSLFVTKDSTGNITTRSETDFSHAESVELESAIRAMLGLDGARSPNGSVIDDFIATEIGITPEDVQEAADRLAPGTSALYLLFEHVWATDLKRAIRNAGGYPIVQGLLTPEVAMMVGAELEAIISAENTIEAAETAKGTAILDSLITIRTAQQEARAAAEEAETAIETANAIRSIAAAEAVRALVTANLVEGSVAKQAVDALVTAGIVDPETLKAALLSMERPDNRREQVSAT